MSFVILNLLKNALASQTKIHIWFNSKERCVYFKDEGSGIFEDKLENIFNEHKLDLQNSTSSEIGLPFCKKVMQAVGGDILVKSVKGEGTEFCLRF